MFKVIVSFVFGTFVFGVVAANVVRTFGMQRWQVSLILVALAVFLYVSSVLLIHYFIRRNAPEFASSEEVIPGMQKWQMTAGMDIVPKWVSLLGIYSFAALFTAVVPYIVLFFK